MFCFISEIKELGSVQKYTFVLINAKYFKLFKSTFKTTQPLNVIINFNYDFNYVPPNILVMLAVK